MKQLELDRKEGKGTSNKINFSVSRTENNEITTEIIESTSKTRNIRSAPGKGLTLKKY